MQVSVCPHHLQQMLPSLDITVQYKGGNSLLTATSAYFLFPLSMQRGKLTSGVRLFPVCVPFHRRNTGGVHVWSGEVYMDGRTEFVQNVAGLKGGEECLRRGV